MPTPSIGRIVRFVLSSWQADQINQRRAAAQLAVQKVGAYNFAHTESVRLQEGNKVEAGEVFPMIITRVWSETGACCVNGQVFLDGNDSFWATSVHLDPDQKPGTWHWPAEQPAPQPVQP